MNEDEKRKTRCCFTGHRPQLLRRPEEDIKVDLENAILKAISEGFTAFISGMCYGVDIWAAEIVIRLKKDNPNIHLIAAIPFPGFDELWEDSWRERYRYLLSQTAYVKVLEPAYSKNAYHTRNAWMVTHSGKVIAVYNREPGGTRWTLGFARRSRVPIDLIKG